MSEPNPTTDSVTANSGSGGASFVGWLIGGKFWPLMRLAFGTGANSYEVDDVTNQRLPVKLSEVGGVTLPVSIATAPVLVAGSAVVGKVGIDQTNPGTTNLVSAGQSGAWNITNISGTVSLPTGAATATGLSTINTTLGTPMQATGGSVGIVAGSALIGDAGLQLRAANGVSTSYTSCVASNNATSVKGSAGSIAQIRVFNNSASIAYLKLYNKASAPNPAADTVFDKILIPANTSGAGAVLSIQYGQKFTTGIAFAVVSGFGDTDNTSVAASAYSVTILYA